MTHTTLTQVSKSRWEDKNGNFIWRNDFGQYEIRVNGNCEVAATFEDALKVMDSDRYWN